MELDEMKATWELMSDKLTKQKEENLQLLEIMKKQEYKSKLGKIGNSEYLGTIICYIAAAYLGVKLPEINDGLMQLFAVICILLLFALPIISFKSIRG